VNSDLRATKLYRAVVAARNRLRTAEDRHEHLLDEGSFHHRGAVREYAAAVQDYTNTVMSWLSSLETHGDGDDLLPDAEEKTATADGTATEA
jgi:hypothetical protein